MATKLATLTILLVFCWAIVESSDLGKVVDRFRKPKSVPSIRQVEVVAEDATHRRVKHALGETEVPVDPQRIVSLVGAGTDSLLALGVKPVLATSSAKEEASLSYLSDRLKGVPLLRQGASLNLEEVLAAKPDLILAGNREGRYYAQLSKIAPTVCLTSDAGAHKENRILDVGDIVGKSKEARALLADYERHVSAARQTLAKYAAGQPVVFLRFRGNTCVIYTQASMFGPLLFEQLGLTPDPAMPVNMALAGWDVLSVERISRLQAEHIFVVIDPDSRAYFNHVAETPIWRELPAVRHGHIHPVVSSTWLGGEGVLGCRAIVDDVLAALVPDRSTDAAR